MTPLLQMKTADSANVGILASVTRLFSHFWVEPGDEANARVTVILCKSGSGTVVYQSLFFLCLGWMFITDTSTYLQQSPGSGYLSLPLPALLGLFWYDHSPDCSHLRLTCVQVHVCAHVRVQKLYSRKIISYVFCVRKYFYNEKSELWYIFATYTYQKDKLTVSHWPHCHC